MQSFYRTHLYGKCHMYFIKSFVEFMLDHYLAYFVIYCIYGIDLINTRAVLTKLGGA